MMRVGLLGMGTVGSVVARRLVEDRALISGRAGTDLELAAIAVRHPERGRAAPGGMPVVGDAAGLVAQADLDIIIELIGGDQPAGSLIEAALGAGRGIVTANKAVIARRGPALIALAHGKQVPLRYEAAVGGGMPVISLLRDSLRGERILSLEAVINGTTNFILDRMLDAGLSLEAGVADAQARGYAEADPATDLDGEDAACKLGIMARLAFGTHVDPRLIEVIGIRELQLADLERARELGFVIRLIACGRQTAAGISLAVRPTLVPLGHPLAAVRAAGNGVVVRGDLAGAVTLAGAGAGGDATASAVISDLVWAARMMAAGDPGEPPAEDSRLPLLEAEEVEVGAYLRLEISGDPEAAATVTLMLEDRGVPIEATVEREMGEGGSQEMICLTAPAPRALLLRALETLDTVATVREVVTCLDRLTEAG